LIKNIPRPSICAYCTPLGVHAPRKGGFTTKPRESSDNDDFPAVIKLKPSSPRKEMTCHERTDAFMEEIRKLRSEMEERIASLEADRTKIATGIASLETDCTGIETRIASLEADRDRKNAVRRLRQFFQENSAGRDGLQDGAVRRFHDCFMSEVNGGRFHAPHESSTHDELATTG
jgi:hypothetical protein